MEDSINKIEKGIMSLGLKRGIVKLEAHDKQWDDIANQTIKELKVILGDDVIDIQHIGSTAIPTIKAKPIIDIVVGVNVMGDMEKDIRTHHIHVVKWNETEWKNYIHFRDYLNANEDVALQYQKLKEELEGKYADDRAAYTMGKRNMIDMILNN